MKAMDFVNVMFWNAGCQVWSVVCAYGCHEGKCSLLYMRACKAWSFGCHHRGAMSYVEKMIASSPTPPASLRLAQAKLPIRKFGKRSQNRHLPGVPTTFVVWNLP